MKIRIPLVAIFVFSTFAIVGPLIRAATWPPSIFWSDTSSPIYDFIYDLVLYLWPTQMLAVIEVNSGFLAAIVLSVGANILLFALIGTVAGFLARSRQALFILYVAVCVAVAFLALWSAGSIEHINLISFGIVLLLYALPFWLASRFTGVDSIESDAGQ